MANDEIESVLVDHGFTVSWNLGENSWIKATIHEIQLWILVERDYVILVTTPLTDQTTLRLIFQTIKSFDFHSGAYIPQLDRGFGGLSVFVFFRQKTDKGHQEEADEIIKNFGNFVDDLIRLG